MSTLNSALSISANALGVQQLALQTTANNVANAANPDYAREVVDTTPGIDTEIQPGIFVGTGIDLTGVQREVDDSLNDRLRAATSDAASASTTSQWVGQVQTAVGGLSDNDLSTAMSTFFNDWSDVANNPTDTGQRQVTIQDGVNLASSIQKLSDQLGTMQQQANGQLPQQVASANSLADQIANLNVQIVQASAGTSGVPNALEDQRDADLKQLSQLTNISVQRQANGSDTVYIGSDPLVEGQTNHGLSVKNLQAADGTVTPTVVFTDTSGTAPITSGTIGALAAARGQITTVQTQVDAIAKQLIQDVNDLHASGQGSTGITTVTGTNQVTDPTAALNSAAAGLEYPPANGSFVVHVTNSNGASVSTLVTVSLKGKPSDTTLNSLEASLNGISGVSASIVNGALKVSAANAGSTISFSQDSSNTLAALGINTFFTGSSAEDIAVNPVVQNDPTQLAAGKNGAAGDNGTALAIAALETTPAAGESETLQSTYQGLVTTVADTVATAKSQASAATATQSTLLSQQQSTSGVSLDEEMVNMIQQQQAFQASSRVVATIQTMMASLIAMV
jgi:flagellar hook-associated protein 1 FlgK